MSKTAEKGSAMLLFSLLLWLVLLPMVGLAIDGALVYVAKSRLNAAVDAAALAAGRALTLGTDAETRDVAYRYFAANYPVGFLGTQAIRWTQPQINHSADAYQTVDVSAEADVPLAFLRILGYQTATVAASAQTSRRDVNVVLVLDRSGSMGPVCSTMKQTAQNFVSGFADGRDVMGMFTFMAAANPADYPPTTNFKTQSPTLASKIGQLVCSGSTGSAEALYQAHQMIRAARNLPNRSLALNVVVFFTDGSPNGYHATFPIKSGSTCDVGAGPGMGSKAGILVQSGGNTGLHRTTLVSISSNDAPMIGNNSTADGTKNCEFDASRTRPSKLENSIAYYPDQDTFGNLADPPNHYRSVSKDADGRIIVDPYMTQSNTDAIGRNAADYAARLMRQDNIVVYTIGLDGNGGFDPVLLQRVANDPTYKSTPGVYDSSQPAGKYAYAANAGQLAAAFNSIRSEILRISR